MATPHIFNVKRDEHDSRDHFAAPAPAGVLPMAVSLRPWLGPVKNQGQLGSCTAHAGTSLREYLYRRYFGFEKYKNIPATGFRLSPLFLYWQERFIEGTLNSDEGAQSRTIFKALSSVGCCLESSHPYEDTRSGLLSQPTNDMDLEGLRYRSVSYHRVADVHTLKSVLASGYTATVGTPVYAEIESDECAATGLLRLPRANSTELGGHEMHVVGYDDSKNVLGERGALDVQNSWGLGWGDNGHVWVPYSYFSAVQAWDFWTCHLGKPW